MIDFKKIDEEDFIFISKPLNKQEDKAFSDFLKNRKLKTVRVKKVKEFQANQ